MEIFQDLTRIEGKCISRLVGIEESKELLKIYAVSADGIIPALHYLETHPKERKQPIQVIKLNEFPEVSDTTTFKEIISGRYPSYNYIILSEMRSDFSEILSGYSKLLEKMQNVDLRKIRILEIESYMMSRLLKITKMKKEFGKGNCYYEESPNAFYLHAERFGRPGLRHQIGFNGTLNFADLENRIIIN